MNNILTILLFLSSCLCVHAQAVLKSGQLTKKTSEMAFMDIEPIGTANDKYFYILYPYSYFMNNTIGSTKEIQIGRVNENMNLEKTAVLDLKKDEVYLNYEFSLQSGGNIYIFSSAISNKTTLYYQILDKDKLIVEGEPKKIMVLEHLDDNIKSSSFTAHQSPDKSKILINYALGDKDGDMVEMGIQVLDNKFNHLLRMSNDQMSVQDGIYSFEKYIVDNKGNVFVTTRFYADKKEYKSSAKYKKKWFLSGTSTLIANAVYDYKMIQVNKDGSVKLFDLNLPQKFITTMMPSVNPKQQIVCGGLYSNPGSTSVRGAFHFTIDPASKKMINYRSFAFDHALITKGMDARDAEKVASKMTANESWEEYQYITEDIVYRKDGSMALILEQFMKQSKTQNSGRVVTTYTVFKTDDIMVVNFDNSGDMEWAEKIIKSQETIDYGFMYYSFNYEIIGDDLYFLFTELDKKKINMLGKFKDTEATLVKLDRHGNEKKSTLFNLDSIEVTFRPMDTQKLKDGDMILMGQLNERNYKFIKVSLN